MHLRIIWDAINILPTRRRIGLWKNIIEPAKLKAATTYNAAADHFDDGPLAFWDRYGQRTIERLRLKSGSVVLDVGCGSGASAIPAGKVVGPHGRVIGADLADRLLAMARAKAAAQKLENIEFREADMEALGYPDASFSNAVALSGAQINPFKTVPV